MTAASGGPSANAANAKEPRRPAPTAPFHPPSDTSTYRDLLLFEERLKLNAEMLRRRRRRYSVFLWSFLAGFVLMAYRLVVLPPDNHVLLRALQAAVAVSFITLALFFASGMYEEKIRYAHSYINHSNKSLRPLNMYLNVRRAPNSWLSFLPLPKALRPAPAPFKAHPVGLAGKGRPAGAAAQGRRVSNSSQTVMAQIPPATNPRGELIFSSRVEPHFEEGYKRYRAAFERRREERAREEAKARGPWWIRWARKAPPPPTHRAGAASPAPAASPPGSRRGTPEPAHGSRSPQRGPSPHRRGTRGASPPASRERSPEREGNRERAESYSFVYTGPGEAVSAKAARK